MGSIPTLDFIGANTSAAAELANETVIETAHGVVWPSAPQCVHGAIFDLDGTLLDSMPCVIFVHSAKRPNPTFATTSSALPWRDRRIT